MDTKEKYTIIGGPSKAELFDACKYAYHPRNEIVLDFEIVAGYTAPPTDPKAGYIPLKIKDIVVNGISHEDGSGDSFNLSGYCQVDFRLYATAPKWEPRKFEAYYNAKRREGYFSFP